MSGPRLSIIPAGAVTDRSLKRGDLQVLCLLGRHIDRAGWCVRSQVRMAAELGCARASVQRSLDRLAAAGWVEIKSRADDASRGDRSYAYRVRLDQDDEVTATYAENASQGGGCPPAGTPPSSVDNSPFLEGGVPNRLGRGVPNRLGRGCPGRNGHHNDPLERPKDERLVEDVDKIGGRVEQPSPDALTKPPNGSQGRGMVWWDHGTTEWQLYADDYFEHRGVKKNPEQRIGGSGNWFILIGEPENGNHRVQNQTPRARP
jgi:hypothetical protein